MALTDEDKEKLAAGLLALPQDKLDELHESLVELNDRLGDANTAYPATQEFLQARGLTHVRQLDKKGVQELRQHLESTLQALCKAKA